VQQALTARVSDDAESKGPSLKQDFEFDKILYKGHFQVHYIFKEILVTRIRCKL
jgi:hypothetical protein